MHLPLLTLLGGQYLATAAFLGVAVDQTPYWLTAVVAVAPVVNTFLLYLMHRRGKRIERSVNATKREAREAGIELRDLKDKK